MRYGASYGEKLGDLGNLCSGGEQVCGRERPLLGGSPIPGPLDLRGCDWKPLEGHGRTEDLGCVFVPRSTCGSVTGSGCNSRATAFPQPDAIPAFAALCPCTYREGNAPRIWDFPLCFPGGCKCCGCAGFQPGPGFNWAVGPRPPRLIFLKFFFFFFGLVSTAGISVLLLCTPQSRDRQAEKWFLAGGFTAAGGSPGDARGER